MIRSVRLPVILPSLVVFAVAGSACRERPDDYREVPHEVARPASPSAMPRGPMESASAPSPAGPGLTWTAPAAWTSRPGSEMRLGSYAFTAANGDIADVSVFSFPDAAGGLVANINRWRGQVGLAPVPEDEIATTATATEIAGQQAWLVDFAGTPKASAPAMGSTPPPSGPTRIIGAIVPLEGKAWFFKMMGPEAVVASQRENFQKLVASIEVTAAPAVASTNAPASDPHAGIAGAPPIGAAAGGDPHAGVAGAPPMGGMGAMDAAGIPPPPEPATGISFETPPGWQAQPNSQFRLASFKVPGSGVPEADVSVTNFPGTVGGDFANINRWRGQLGLPAISEAEFPGAVQHVSGQQGLEFVVADLESTQPMIDGHRARMLAAILKLPDSTFFFKMTGETELVASQREAFMHFLKSFHFEDGAAH